MIAELFRRVRDEAGIRELPAGEGISHLHDSAKARQLPRFEERQFTTGRSDEGFMGSRRGGRRRLLYLGFAFPPGIAALNPEVNPAGHALETRMVSELRRSFEVRSVGILPFVPPQLERGDPSSGLAHSIVLVEKPPELPHRARALRRLKADYSAWRAGGWVPEVVLVYNLSPIYNQFLLWLRRQQDCPKLVLLLLDSPNLGHAIPWLKRLRHRFKPMMVPDARMLEEFDACVGLSRAVEKYFVPRRVPFLWLPGGCAPERACFESNGFGAPGNHYRFGYFGALGAHAGVKPLVETFLAHSLAATLEVCGYGKGGAELSELARQQTGVRFHGLLSPSECLRFGRSCDLLINPRPASHGNENNFASKLFDYALTGRAILTARLSGVESVLGPEAFYFDPGDFQRSLGARLGEAVALPRSELDRRGAAIQVRVLEQFSWQRQGGRLAEFLESLCAGAPARLEVPAALAA